MESEDAWSSQASDEATTQTTQTTQSVRIKCVQAAWDDDEDPGDKSECTSEDDEEDEDEDENQSWDGELQNFLEEPPEFRAKVQYQVRVIALIPGFEASGRKLSLFPSFYKLRFGKNLTENTGFTSAEILCKCMPHIIQRNALEKQHRVVLVDSIKNMRIVAGIRSGLRRIVFHVLKHHPKGISAKSLDEECSRLAGRPLSLVLAELAYDTPNVESMIRDMGDIACYAQRSGSLTVFLSSEAEDPGLTDGILLLSGWRGDETLPRECRKRVVSNGEVLDARIRTVLLLALHSGGIELNRLQKAYAELYTESLDSWGLGYGSTEELVRDWGDIVLFQDSVCPHKVFLRSCEETCRMLSSFSSGLRFAVFCILQERYPEGVEPGEMLRQLHRSYAEEVKALNTVQEDWDFQLHELCLMVHDMRDFVAFGCREDGSLVLKLRNEGVPVVEFPDFTSSGDEFVELLVRDRGGRAVVRGFESVRCKREEEEFQVVEEVKTDVDRSQLVLEQRIRLISGSYYQSGGVSREEFVAAYKERCGETLSVGQLESFLARTPGLLRLVRGSLYLVESPINLRILQATRAGLRQILFWALVKNPGGVWCELLEGWFTDFTGYSLTSVLLRHGYSCSDRTSLAAVREFLNDMNDICEAKKTSSGLEFHVLVDGLVDDPAVSDSRLLSSDDVEYDPVKLCISMEEPLEQEQEQQEEKSVKTDEEEEYKYVPPRAYATPLVVS